MKKYKIGDQVKVAKDNEIHCSLYGYEVEPVD